MYLYTRDKNCKVTKSHKKQKKCEYKDSESQSPVKYMCSGKNCQEKENNNMQSVTNTVCDYANQESEDCARIKNANLQDATRVQ